jgi:hypothetical protein
MSIPNDFSSTANAAIVVPPFRDSTGTILTSGVVTVKVRSPAGVLVTQAGPGTTSGVTLSALDAEGASKVTIDNATCYEIGGGDYTVTATSTGAGAVPQTGAFRWGTGLAEQLRLSYARMGAPVGASMSADLADVKNSADLANLAATNALAQATTAATEATAAAAAALIIRKVETNRYKIVGTQLIIYDDNGTTPFKTFNLFDDVGSPTSTRIFERVPV